MKEGMAGKHLRIIAALASCFLAFSQPAQAQAPATRQPKRPPSLFRPTPEDRFGCRRQFIYRGQVLDCDSNAKQDAQRLREIVQSVPEAAAEIDEYQRNRRQVRATAYAATGGIALAAILALVAGQYSEGDKLSSKGIAIRNTGVAIGGGIAVGSLLYGFSLIRTNETHLDRAVQLFNAANPQDTIELRFSTGISF